MRRAVDGCASRQFGWRNIGVTRRPEHSVKRRPPRTGVPLKRAIRARSHRSRERFHPTIRAPAHVANTNAGLAADGRAWIRAKRGSRIPRDLAAVVSGWKRLTAFRTLAAASTGHEQ